MSPSVSAGFSVMQNPCFGDIKWRGVRLARGASATAPLLNDRWKSEGVREWRSEGVGGVVFNAETQRRGVRKGNDLEVVGHSCPTVLNSSLPKVYNYPKS